MGARADRLDSWLGRREREHAKEVKQDRASIFGDFRFRIDPWEVDYGDQIPLAPSDEVVTTDNRRPGGRI